MREVVKFKVGDAPKPKGDPASHLIALKAPLDVHLKPTWTQHINTGVSCDRFGVVLAGPFGTTVEPTFFSPGEEISFKAKTNDDVKSDVVISRGETIAKIHIFEDGNTAFETKP